jgi:hypothetical protein
MEHGDLLNAFARNGISGRGGANNFLFAPSDITFGTETELQTAVRGARDTVDLPLTIENSNYYYNISKRIERGDAPKKLLDGLRRYLDASEGRIWENSSVWFPRTRLSPVAREVFRSDLYADKQDRSKGLRSDAREYTMERSGVEYLRVPVSYLLKLALADSVSAGPPAPEIVFRKGLSLMDCFTNDNTSPETHSFRVNRAGRERLTAAAARDMSRRFLLTQLLALYANDKFGLRDMGQEVFIYFSPHPPVRQRNLNSCISDAFYRELFMSPCLSGWAEGEKKSAYMHLCHETLSRSHLNAVLKLKEAGIITSGLVVLPNTSNISLANNGTHLSQASVKLGSLIEDPGSGFTSLHEKYVSDLVVKIVEHFIPLFVGTYSASPYRIDFKDFHPERTLGFLPHELDFTHLRMLWRKWRKKADIRIFKRSVTPFGPSWLDGLISSLFRLRGDFVPDFRIIDYLICLMSTEKSPALNGMHGNTKALKNDLAELGVFHPSMPLYLFFRPREYGVKGFSGFEGRHYSLFEGFEHDFGRAALLQAFITSWAFRKILGGSITHRHIPDSPFVESERRQVVFGAAIGIPTFYMRTDTENLFLRDIVTRTVGIRNSARYPGCVRVSVRDYLDTLLKMLKEDSDQLPALFDMSSSFDDLADRLRDDRHTSVASRLVGSVVGKAGTKNALDMAAEDFNLAAEHYYRTDLRRKQLRESLALFRHDLSHLEKHSAIHNGNVRGALDEILSGHGALSYLVMTTKAILEEDLPAEEIRRLIRLIILTEYAEATEEEYKRETHDTSPVHRAGNA